MTAQCAANGMWVALDAVRVLPGDSVGASFSTVYRRVRAVCKRAGVRPVLLMYREFPVTGVPGRLARHGTRRPVPCPNSPRAAAAIRKSVSGGRPAV